VREREERSGQVSWVIAGWEQQGDREVAICQPSRKPVALGIWGAAVARPLLCAGGASASLASQSVLNCSHWLVNLSIPSEGAGSTHCRMPSECVVWDLIHISWTRGWFSQVCTMV